jgi:glycosyltransferase involved in cell wall biosynthesis
MTFLEAQAAGLPVVAGRSGGVGDVVAEGEGGVLVAAGDDAAFAGAIARLLDDAESLPAMGERAQRRVCRHHDVSTAAAALDGALRRVRFACERWR